MIYSICSGFYQERNAVEPCQELCGRKWSFNMGFVRDGWWAFCSNGATNQAAFQGVAGWENQTPIAVILAHQVSFIRSNYIYALMIFLPLQRAILRRSIVYNATNFERGQLLIPPLQKKGKEKKPLIFSRFLSGDFGTFSMKFIFSKSSLDLCL